MSILGYFGPARGDLRLKPEDIAGQGLSAIPDQPDVSLQPLSADDILAQAARGVRPGERYGGVEEYDPVLRAHCRLDRKG
jgi:hypothetical protein